MKPLLALFSLLALLFLTGCATSSAGSDSNPALGGYCPVCYLEAGEAVMGSPEFAATHSGKVYYFVSSESRSAFQQDPERYLPAYDGWCAYGVAFGQKVEVDPRVFSVIDGTLYLNKNRWVGRSFDKDPAKFIAQADGEWPKLNPASSGS